MTDWVYIDTAILKAARGKLGLSYEAMGGKLKVAAKTWERYEKKGRVPRHLLPRIAEILDLEIDWPKPARVAVTEAGEDDPLAMLEQRLGEVLDLVQQLRGEQLAQQPVPPVERARGDRAT